MSFASCDGLLERRARFAFGAEPPFQGRETEGSSSGHGSHPESRPSAGASWLSDAAAQTAGKWEGARVSRRPRGVSSHPWLLQTPAVSALGGEAEPGELRGVRISISRFPSPLSFPRTVALCGLILFLCLCSLGSVSSAALGKCGLSHGRRAGGAGAGHRGGWLSFTSPPCLLRGHVSQGTLSRLLPQSEASSQLLPRGPHYRVRRFIRLQEPQDSFMLGMLALMLFTMCIMLI